MENKKHSVKLSKALYDEAKRVYVTYDKADESGLYKTIYLPLPKQQSLDINAYLIEQSDEFEKLARNLGLAGKSVPEKQLWMASSSQQSLVKEMLKNVSVIAVTDNISVKYSIIYNIYFQAANTHVNIDKIQSAPMSEDDYKNTKDA